MAEGLYGNEVFWPRAGYNPAGSPTVSPLPCGSVLGQLQICPKHITMATVTRVESHELLGSCNRQFDCRGNVKGFSTVQVLSLLPQELYLQQNKRKIFLWSNIFSYQGTGNLLTVSYFINSSRVIA